MKKKKKPSFFTNGRPSQMLTAVVLFFLGLTILTRLTEYMQKIDRINYSEFIAKVESDQVRKVSVTGNSVVGEYIDGERFATVVVDTPTNWDMLRKHNVVLEINPVDGISKGTIFLGSLLLILLVAVLGWFVMRSRQSGGSGGPGAGQGIFSFGKSRAKMFLPATIKENFNSVAGAVEAKEELADVIDYLKNPKRYERLGAKITRGILLVGEPGNGKTLLARAVAGEANCPFFSISGSDFIEVFVGVGASRVRDLFAQARKNAPCIVFIDEIDAVGRHRGSGLGGGNDEREQTLNQLLTEMDGFEISHEPVIVLSATNRPDVLDKALLRPGRFDRRVDVPFPDLKSREEILNVHVKRVKLSPNVDLHKIARGTPGFSGADLANLVNEAAITATKKDKSEITIQDFEEARDKITLGKESKTKMLTEQDRKITAWHEAGHALITLMLPEDTDPLHKITIIPRGLSLGVTHSMPEREKYTQTKREIVARIKMALGGRVAEELVFDTITTGASSDFRMATELARQMVCSFGMTDELGKVVYSQAQGSFVYSQDTAREIDATVKRIIDECYEHSKELIVKNRDKLDTLAQALLEKETMYAGQVYELLGIEPREDHKLA